MIYKYSIKRYSSFIQGFLTSFVILVVIRLLILSINLDDFYSGETGRLNILGENIKFIQLIIENITNAIVIPFRDIIMRIFSNLHLQLANILAPVFSIIFLFFLKLIVRIITPYILYYVRNSQYK